MTEAKPTILVVEDEPEIRRFLRSSLGAEGYRVVEAETGARGAIDAGTHKPDLLIVDLGLPDMDGIDVIRRIRGWSPMPILVLSARAGALEVELDALAPATSTHLPSASASCSRVRVALRHGTRPSSGAKTLSFR